MTDELDLLSGVDEPRPLPPELRRRLESRLTGEDPAVVALAGADRPRELPGELLDRLADALTAGRAVSMPPPVRRRLERTLIARPVWRRGAAVAAVLLFVAASAAVIGRDRTDPGDNVAAGTPKTAAMTPTTAAAVVLEPEGEASRPAAATAAPVERATPERTPPTTAAFSARAGGDAATEAPARAGAAAAMAAPSVTVTPSTARRGEEVTARVEGFSTNTVRHTLRAPSGRVVLEGEAPASEFRFTVPLVTENGAHVLTVEGGGQSAQTSFDVVT